MIILKRKPTKKTIIQTIRFDGDLYDQIMDIAEYNNITFNNTVNQLLQLMISTDKERKENTRPLLSDDIDNINGIEGKKNSPY